MDNLNMALFDIDWKHVALAIFILFSVIILLVETWKKIKSIFGIEFKAEREKREEHELLIKTSRNAIELQAHHEQDVNLLKEQLSSFITEMRTEISDISVKIDALKQNTDSRFDANEEKQNKRVQAEIKDKIAQSYRRYHRTNKISHMELEALKDLIQTYEDHGGINSFVHSTVQQEMYTWEEI